MHRKPREDDTVAADLIRCEACGCVVDELTTVAKRRGYLSDGCGELMPFCSECIRREFAAEPPASGALSFIGVLAGNSGS